MYHGEMECKYLILAWTLGLEYAIYLYVLWRDKQQVFLATGKERSKLLEYAIYMSCGEMNSKFS
jgi:hypothetical protein